MLGEQREKGGRDIQLVEFDLGLVLRLWPHLRGYAVIDVGDQMLEALVQLVAGRRLARLELVQLVLELLVFLCKVA